MHTSTEILRCSCCTTIVTVILSFNFCIKLSLQRAVGQIAEPAKGYAAPEELETFCTRFPKKTRFQDFMIAGGGVSGTTTHSVKQNHEARPTLSAAWQVQALAELRGDCKLQDGNRIQRRKILCRGECESHWSNARVSSVHCLRIENFDCTSGSEVLNSCL